MVENFIGLVSVLLLLLGDAEREKLRSAAPSAGELAVPQPLLMAHHQSPVSPATVC